MQCISVSEQRDPLKEKKGSDCFYLKIALAEYDVTEKEKRFSDRKGRYSLARFLNPSWLFVFFNLKAFSLTLKQYHDDNRMEKGQKHVSVNVHDEF